MELTTAPPEQAVSSRSKAEGSISISPNSHSELPRKITALAELTAQQLRAEWRRLYRSHSPRLSRDLLIRTIAYRMQELAYGGLSKATKRKLMALTKGLESIGSIAPDRGRDVRPGMRLVREWRGRTHTVVVTEDGFEYLGKTYSSLSQIAQAITGAHWSGPRFFGLNRTQATGAQSDGNLGIVDDDGEASHD